MRRVALFIHQHGKVLFFCLVLCVAMSAVTERSAAALVDIDIKNLGKGIRDLSPLNAQQNQDEVQGRGGNGTSTNPTGNRDSSSTSPAPKVDSVTSSQYKSASSPAGNIEPVPAIDTSAVPYSPLLLAPFGAVTTASVINEAPSTASDPPSGVPIEVSSGGWRLGGVAWYWWLLLMLIAALGIRGYSSKKKQLRQEKLGEH